MICYAALGVQLAVTVVLDIMAWRDFETWFPRAALFYGVLNLGWALNAMVKGHISDMLFWGVLSAAWFYAWWRRRPKKRKRASRVASRVKDVGHRLVVVPVKA